MRNLRVVLLGPQIEHLDSLRAQLAPNVAALSWIPDHHTYLREHPGSRPFGALHRLDVLWGTRDPTYLDRVLRELDESQAGVVVAYWGTLPLPDIQAIKKARPGLKIALMVLCYPLSLSTMGIVRQRFSMERALPFLDGAICPTAEMADFLRTRDFAGSRLPIHVVRPCWPRGFQASHRSASPTGHPNLIYVGRTDLSGRTIHAADDVRPLMLSLLAAGIELHHVRSPETDDGHPLRRPFAPVALPELIAKMGGYDASLVTYNLSACQRTERFSLTVPDRLISSVAAGVPVALPSQGYEASRSFLADYPALIEFDGPSDLREALADRPRLEALRESAWGARGAYAAEAHSERLLGFLGQLITG